MSMNTVERACGRWREILPLFGIEARFLRNRHGPCPLCGRKDRFRFNDRDGSGSYYCNQCDAGTGLLMIRKLKGWDHKTACDAVDEIIGGDRDHADTKISSRRDSPETHRRAIMRLLDRAHHPDVVTAYLRRRGLAVTSDVLKGNRYCPYYDENGKLVGYFTAVIAPIIGPDGSLQSVQRIYTAAGLDPRKKIMSPVNTICGGAVQLLEPEDELGVAEGVETALAAYQLFGVPVWAVLCEAGLKTFVTPAGVGVVHIFADNDAHFVGQEAAYTLARRLVREGRATEVHIPENIDGDWLDVLASQS